MTILGAAALNGAGALLWLAQAWVLARFLPGEALGEVLFAIAISGLGGGLAGAGHVQLMLREGARHLPESAAFRGLFGEALVGAARGALLAATVILAGAASGLLAMSATAATFTIAATGITALTGILASAQRARGAARIVLWAQGPLRPALSLAVTVTAAPFVQLDGTTCLALHALGLALAAFPLFHGLPRPARFSSAKPGTGALWRGQAGWILLSQLDILAVGLLLAPAEGAAYLIARRIAGTAALVYDALRVLEAPELSRAFRNGTGPASAERCNLRFAGAGIAAFTGTLLSIPFLPVLFGETGAAAAPLLPWLALAQAAPALFGATGLLLTMASLDAPRARLNWAVVLAGAPILALGASIGAAQGLTLATAGVLLGYAALAACVLFRRLAIRPGLLCVIAAGLRFGRPPTTQ